VVHVGDKLRVEIADIDKRGKISLLPVADDTAAEEPGDVAAPSSPGEAELGAAPADAATASS
jgi:polyribonucleotide nucleotidyltransferase